MRFEYEPFSLSMTTLLWHTFIQLTLQKLHIGLTLFVVSTLSFPDLKAFQHPSLVEFIVSNGVA